MSMQWPPAPSDSPGFGETPGAVPGFGQAPETPPTYGEPTDTRPSAPEQPFATPPRSVRTRNRRLREKLGAAGAAIVALLAKFKALILLLPKVKLLATLGTGLVSLVAYASIWGWQFAAGFILLLFVHEMGHVIQLRREGLKASAPMFIPFMGAVISARSLGDNALAEARVGLAGPILGSVGAAACVGLWHATGNDLFRALAYFGFFLNLFNLIPVVPLDGGRAMAAMAPWMWLLGFLILLPLVFVFTSPILLIIVALAGFETYRRWQRRHSGDPEQEAYYRVKPVDRVLVAAVYLALIGLLVTGMHATYLARTLN